jgi:hypothetical protein
MKIEDLTGEWVLSGESPGLPKSANRNAVIQLNADGLFRASRIPVGMVGVNHSSPEIVDGTGLWHIASFDGKPKVYLVFKQITGAPDAVLPYGRPLEISGFPYPRRLYYFVGDPDEKRVIDFTRR